MLHAAGICSDLLHAFVILAIGGADLSLLASAKVFSATAATPGNRVHYYYPRGFRHLERNLSHDLGVFHGQFNI